MMDKETVIDILIRHQQELLTQAQKEYYLNFDADLVTALGCAITLLQEKQTPATEQYC